MTVWGAVREPDAALDERRWGMLAGPGELRTVTLDLRAVGPWEALNQGQTWMWEGGFRSIWKGWGPKVRRLSWRGKPRMEGLPWGD